MSLACESWEDFRAFNADFHFGTEHVVDADEFGERMYKITIPPKFGLIPQVMTHLVPNLRGEPGSKKAIEFGPATPLKYLDRWIAVNEVFEDDVRLTAVIQWSDGQVSFAISQPQYHGDPASEKNIEQHFAR